MFVFVAAAINTAISLVYYLRVAKTMCIDSPPDTSRPVQLDLLATSYVVMLTLPVVLLGFLPDRVAQWTQQAAAGLFN
jgi:NADH:ubiquinone oxidoreductase subunit 2 (subunit N)